MPTMTELEDLQYEAWMIAEESGFHEGEEAGEDARSRAKILALIHSEVSEALEADREGDEENYREELADTVIRILDHAETEEIDLTEEIEAKFEKNREREFRHGKEY